MPEVRIKGFNGEWIECKLKEIVERVIRKNTKLESTLPLTISAQYGLVDQVTFFNKQVASKDVSNYYLLKKGEFAYNKSYSNGYPWGVVKRLDRYDMGVLSTLYIIFKPTRINSNFLVAYYDSTQWHKEVSMRAAEGARNHGLLNISASDFFESRINFPEKEGEQTQIGNFFKQLDETITIQQQELDTLKQMKHGFFQKMFPKEKESVPEIRFPGFSGEWEAKCLGEISESYSGGTPSVDNKTFYGGDIPFIRSAEINAKTTELYITEEGFNSSSTKMVRIGDILYALYGATSGEVGISKINGAINQAVLAIKPKRGYDSYFLTQWLKKEKSSIINTYLQGGQGNLSGSIVKKLIVKIPIDEKEQTEIGHFFKQLDETIALYEQELDILKQTKKAFLQKMFV